MIAPVQPGRYIDPIVTGIFQKNRIKFPIAAMVINRLIKMKGVLSMKVPFFMDLYTKTHSKFGIHNLVNELLQEISKKD